MFLLGHVLEGVYSGLSSPPQRHQPIEFGFYVHRRKWWRLKCPPTYHLSSAPGGGRSSSMGVVVFSPTLLGPQWWLHLSHDLSIRGCTVSVICSKINEGGTGQDVHSFLYQGFSWCVRVSHAYQYRVSSLTSLSPGSVSIEIAHFQQVVSLISNFSELNLCVRTWHSVCGSQDNLLSCLLLPPCGVWGRMGPGWVAGISTCWAFSPAWNKTFT